MPIPPDTVFLTLRTWLSSIWVLTLHHVVTNWVYRFLTLPRQNCWESSRRSSFSEQFSAPFMLQFPPLFLLWLMPLHSFPGLTGSISSNRGKLDFMLLPPDRVILTLRTLCWVPFETVSSSPCSNSLDLHSHMVTSLLVFANLGHALGSVLNVLVWWGRSRVQIRREHKIIWLFHSFTY